MMQNSYNNEAASIAGAILAGGKASRYGGIAKGLLDAGNGKSIISHIAGEMEACRLNEVITIANDAKPYSDLGLAVVPDMRTSFGPLAGVEAALQHYAGKYDAIAILPCDTPGITRSEIEMLLSQFRASDTGIVAARTGKTFWHPLCAVINVRIRDELSQLMNSGVRSVGQAWERLGAAPVDFPETSHFHNVNRPEDMKRWKERQMRE